jgi:mannan endo-1,4-beta-mannosidase
MAGYLRNRTALTLGVHLLCASAVGCLKTPDRYAQSTLDVNINPPANFELDNKPFCFVGTNNYYLAYKPKRMVDDVLASAHTMGFPVVRIWAFIDVGSPDGTGAADTGGDGSGKKDGIYFQYWDPKLQRPAYNETDTGLVHLDYALAKARESGVKLMLVLTNNWTDFGGMDQYLKWYGRTKHHEFYTESNVKTAYKDWVAHLVGRKNTITGTPYRDDPTIFGWELANEPRCKGSGAGSPGWDTSTIPTWTDEMSRYIKSLDPNHLVSVGDEGFLNGGGDHWAYKANDGVDHEAITAVPGVDFGTFHMYPEDWGAGLEWGKGWIADHERVARRLGKPTVLEEYGVKVSRDDQGNVIGGLDTRIDYYTRWNSQVLKRGGNAAMAWMLAGVEEAGGVYRDYDHYSFYRNDPTADLLTRYAAEFSTAAPACKSGQGHEGGGGAPSPFVRVHHARAEQLASNGWRGAGG